MGSERRVQCVLGGRAKGDPSTYSFFDLTELLELLSKRSLFRVPCKAAVAIIRLTWIRPGGARAAARDNVLRVDARGSYPIKSFDIFADAKAESLRVRSYPGSPEGH